MNINKNGKIIASGVNTVQVMDSQMKAEHMPWNTFLAKDGNNVLTY